MVANNKSIEAVNTEPGHYNFSNVMDTKVSVFTNGNATTASTTEVRQ